MIEAATMENFDGGRSMKRETQWETKGVVAIRARAYPALPPYCKGNYVILFNKRI